MPIIPVMWLDGMDTIIHMLFQFMTLNQLLAEFTSHHLREWCDLWDIEMVFTQPGKPTQNAFIERFNGTYRREVLECWCFKTLEEVREETERWIREYNTERPHQSLGDLSPILFLQQRGFGQFSIYAL